MFEEEQYLLLLSSLNRIESVISFCPFIGAATLNQSNICGHKQHITKKSFSCVQPPHDSTELTVDI